MVVPKSMPIVFAMSSFLFEGKCFANAKDNVVEPLASRCVDRSVFESGKSDFDGIECFCIENCCRIPSQPVRHCFDNGEFDFGNSFRMCRTPVQSIEVFEDCPYAAVVETLVLIGPFTNQIVKFRFRLNAIPFL